MSIRVLAPDVANKIAAGEVVERPASVVKELVENALDAGATSIAIEIQSGGLKLIRVSDNGAGIPPDEVELAFERHATSKINGAGDLDRISTLGFRGEALPSVAAVAQVEMVTRRAEEISGTYIKLADSRVVETGKKGRSVGTTVTVRGLFSNVPARLKFMKSNFAEAGHISHLVSQISLAFPEVSFVLLNDGRESFHSPGNGSLRDALIAVYGLEVAEGMLPIAKLEEQSEGGPSVSGFVSPPSINRANRNYLSFYVNRRWIHSRFLTYAVEEAYQGMLMMGKHPIAVIGIWIPSSEVDVNVHPAKSEVRFRRERDVFAAVQKAVRQAIINESPIPTVSAYQLPTVNPARQTPANLPLFEPKGERGERVKVSPSPENKSSSLGITLPILRVLGQVNNTYIITEGPDGMYLIDQHSAHERIVFERILGQRSQRAVEVQGLLEPVVAELTPRQQQILGSEAILFSELGFDVEPFGERTCLLRALPAVLRDQNAADALRAVLDTFDSPEEASLGVEERLAISIACHSAIRAGQSLSYDEMRELVRQLEATASPHTCPHGRPTMIHLSSTQLEKEFGRR